MLDFPGYPISTAAQWALAGLLILWAALLVLGLVLGKPDPVRRRRLPLGARMGMSITLVVAAFIWWLAGTAQTPLAGYGLFVLVGMSFGFLGDLFMAGLIVPKPRNVIFGILSFGAGHIAYIAAFWQAGQALGLDLGRTWAIALGIYLFAAAFLWVAAVRNPARGTVMNVGTLGYSLLLCAMGGAAMALALQNAAFAWLAAGGLLFIVSDLILGSEIMRGTSFWSIGDVIWGTYTVAQMLIVYSSSVALHLYRPLLP